MKNAEYWRRRSEILEERQRNRDDKFLKEKLAQYYRQAKNESVKELEAWILRFADENGLTLAEARRVLNRQELEELRWTLAQYEHKARTVSPDDPEYQRVKNASTNWHVDRLQSLLKKIDKVSDTLYEAQVEAISDYLEGAIVQAQLEGAFEFQKGVGFGWDFSPYDKRELELLLSRPWTADDRTFRDRCWTHRDELVESVHSNLVQGLLRGDAPSKLTAKLRDQFDVAEYKAARLVHTERAYFAAHAQGKMYEEYKVDAVEIVETLDSRTCAICGERDRKVIPREEYRPGETVPPFHPNCVLPDTVIASPDGEAIMKSNYSGEIVEFTTAKGRRLSVTPNHIMLTSRGWVRAKNLIQGDQVIYYCGWDKFIVESDPAYDNRVPTIEQLFTSFLKSCSMPPMSVPTTAKDLKGDAIENGKVEVVFIDSLLRSKLDSSAAQFVSDLPLIGACKLGENTFSGNCSLAQFLMAIGLASDGIMGGLSIAHVLLNGSLTHHELIRFRGGAHYNARLQQTEFDNTSCNLKFSGNSFGAFAGSIKGDDFIQRKFFSGVGMPDGDSSFLQNTNNGRLCTTKDISDFCNAFPGVVEFDNIISVDRRLFTGHVYDISSQSTLYLCNGFLSSNCRGFTIAHFPDLNGERVARNQEGEVYYLPGNTTYEEWSKAFVDGGGKADFTKL